MHMDIPSGMRLCSILKIMVDWESESLVFHLGFAINLLFFILFINKRGGFIIRRALNHGWIQGNTVAQRR